jgi:membrane-bound lytic murein transglycosylase F
MKKLFSLLFIVLFLGACSSCEQQDEYDDVDDLEGILQRGKIRVITLYGPLSYFNYKDNVMGYEFEYAEQLSKELGVEMEMIVASNISNMIELLENGEGDLIAYRVPRTLDLQQRISFTEREYVTSQVIVQLKSDSMLTDVLQLAGNKVYVTESSIYHDRIKDLNNEIGGGINIVAVNDSISVDALIVQTAQQAIPMTIADADIARLNKTYFSSLDYSLSISFPQRYAWAVRNDAPNLLAYINNWNAKNTKNLKLSTIYNKYFERTKYFESEGFEQKRVRQLSAFDDYFKKYARTIGWDWRLIAAVAYKESKFDPTIISWAGASGVMQLMPSTARAMGFSEHDLHNPEQSIKAGVKYLKHLQQIFRNIPSEEERISFVLAAYNSGPGHIFDARALALKYGKNPDVWTDNVEVYVRLKSTPEFYSDEVCKHGYLRGDETANYVQIVLNKYDEYSKRISR